MDTSHMQFSVQGDRKAVLNPRPTASASAQSPNQWASSPESSYKSTGNIRQNIGNIRVVLCWAEFEGEREASNIGWLVTD